MCLCILYLFNKMSWAFITHHTLWHAFQMQCIALVIQQLKYQAKICLLGIHMLVIIFMCFVAEGLVKGKVISRQEKSSPKRHIFS